MIAISDTSACTLGRNVHAEVSLLAIKDARPYLAGDPSQCHVEERVRGGMLVSAGPGGQLELVTICDRAAADDRVWVEAVGDTPGPRLPGAPPEPPHDRCLWKYRSGFRTCTSTNSDHESATDRRCDGLPNEEACRDHAETGRDHQPPPAATISNQTQPAAESRPRTLAHSDHALLHGIGHQPRHASTPWSGS